MPWIFLALAIGCMAITMKSQSMGIAIIALLASLGFMLLAALGWISARIQGRAQPSAAVLSPEAIALIRKAREKQDVGPSTAPPAIADDQDDDGAERDSAARNLHG